MVMWECMKVLLGRNGNSRLLKVLEKESKCYCDFLVIRTCRSVILQHVVIIDKNKKSYKQILSFSLLLMNGTKNDYFTFDGC